MVYEYLKRGIVAGTVAGLAYGLFMALVGNPLVEYIDHLAHHGGEHGHEAAVSDLTTTAVSIGSGVMWGIFLGAVFGTVYYFAEPVLPGRADSRVYVLAGAGFLSVSGAPWLALPPVTPGTEQVMAPDARLVLYGGMMCFGAVVCALSIGGFQRLHSRGRLLRVTAAVAPLALLVVPAVLVPTAGRAGVPSDLAVAFRWLVVLSQLGLWGLLAGAYARLDRRGTVASSADIGTDRSRPTDGQSLGD